MKKITNLIILTVLLSSCFGGETVTHTTQKPFVIKKITKQVGRYTYSKNKYEYPITQMFTNKYQQITTDKDLEYNIGDTMNFNPK